jgi:predicted PurR-regulated permease PerM
MASHGRRIEILIVAAAFVVLVAAAFVVLRPFLAPLVWALILTMSTWPTFERVESALGGRKTLAAALMTVLLALGVLLPVAVVGTSLADSVVALADGLIKSLKEGPPKPPDWLKDWPLIGPGLFEYWQGNLDDTDRLTKELAGQIRPAVDWLVSIGAKVGAGVLEVALSVIVAFFFFRDGIAVAARLGTIVGRLGGERALRLLKVAQRTMMAVVYGILGTAIVQAGLAGFGFWLAGVPGAFFLALCTFVLCVLPIGAPLIWLPASLWLFAQGEVGWGIFMLLWGALIVSTIDNFVKPYLVQRGGTLPLLLVFFGILGGALGFGFLGIFIGPTVLAVCLTLIKEWTAGFEPPSPPPAPS